MFRTILLVGFGGALGSILRYLTTLFVSNKIVGSSFPYGTFIVNFAGCLLIGIVFGLSMRYDWLTPQWRIFLTVGICGGYTTFSAFAYENINLIQQGNYLTAFTYIGLSLILCLVAVFLGLQLTKIM